ncbi:unnamed protein product [Urochloa humidicola]
MAAVDAAHFDSALSFLVSFQAHNAGAGSTTTRPSAVIGDLIGRLGSICNGADVGATAASASNSCYSTPLCSAVVSPIALGAFAAAAGNGRLSGVVSRKSLGAGSPDHEAAGTSPMVGGGGGADPAPSAKAWKRKASRKGKAPRSPGSARPTADRSVSSKRFQDESFQ